MDLVRKLLSWTINFVSELPVRFYWLIVPLFIFLATLSVFMMRKMEIRLSFFDELPPDHPDVLRYKEISEKYGGIDMVLFVIEGENLSELKRCAAEVEEKLRQMPEIKHVRGKLPTDFFKKHALFFVEKEKLRELLDFMRRNEEKLKYLFQDLIFPNFIRSWASLAENEILQREDAGEEHEFVRSISNIREWISLITRYFEKGELDSERYKKVFRKAFFVASDEGRSSEAEYFDVDEEYIISKDLKSIVITAIPVKPSDDYNFNKLIYRKSAELKEEAERICGQDIKISLGGTYVALEEQRLYTVRDMRTTFVIALLGTLILYISIFRGIFSLVVVSLSLGVGLALTFGFLMIVYGYVTIMSALFGSFLLGLGIDFIVYVLSRWREFVDKEGVEPTKAVQLAVKDEIPPMFIGATTTSSAFYSVYVSQIQGAKILSVVAGTGILIYFITSVLFTSSLIVLLRRFLVREKIKGLDWLLSPISSFVARVPFPVLGATLVLILLSTIGLRKFGFEYNIRNILPDLPAIHTEDKLVEKFGRSKDYILITAQDLTELDRKTELIKKVPNISKVESIRLFYPDGMTEKLPFIRDMKPLVYQIEEGEVPVNHGVFSSSELKSAFESLQKVASAFVELAILSGTFMGEDEAKKLKNDISKLIEIIERKGKEKSGNGGRIDISLLQKVNAEVVLEFLGDLKTAVESEGFSIDELPSDIKDIFIGKDGSFIILAYPSRPIWEDENFMRFLRAESERVDKDAFSIGTVFLNVTDRVKKDFVISLGLAFFFVSLLVFAGFRNFVYSLMAMAPVTISLFITLGITSLLGIKIHYVDMGTYAILLGAGVDYGVHIVHRLIEEKGNIVHAITGTGRAISIAALTTVVGFGSINFAQFPGLKDFGEILFIGILVSLFVSVFAIPAIFGVLVRANLIKFR